MPVADWRTTAAYEPIVDQDRGGFSWELLRRNPDYRRDYQQTWAQAADGRFPAAWGLRFCG